MNFDFVKVVTAISKAMVIVDKIKSATGKEKAQAVADSVPGMVEALEIGINRDVLSDAAVAKARGLTKGALLREVVRQFVERERA